MLLLHASNTCRVGDIHRYTITYTPQPDRAQPPPVALYLRIKNTALLPLRAAYLHGPYTLYVSVRRKEFQPWPSRTPGSEGREEELRNEDDRRSNGGVGEGGVPEFEPHLKAGASFYATLPLPAELIEDSSREFDRVQPPLPLPPAPIPPPDGGGRRKSVTWVVEVASQVIFSASASVNFEVMLGEDEKCLSIGVGPGTGNASPRPRSPGDDGGGVLNKALKVKLQGTKELWNLPPFPSWGNAGEEMCGGERELDPEEQEEVWEQRRRKERRRKPKKVHLVFITHGLHSNTGADMLFMKEAIDEEYRKGEIAWREKMVKEGKDMEQEGEDREVVIVRGYHENVCRTERGIKYLGRRLSKYILHLVNPHTPPLSPPLAKRSKSRKTHHHPHLAIPPPRAGQDNAPPYEITSISFIGHSLGGLIQTYAIAYIHEHSPDFFILHKPINFVALATPFLGLSNENPIYVKFALDFGLVGRTGQDLGLTWRAPFPTFAKPSAAGETDTSKPLLRILPTGPAHDVLKLFRNRTLYANVVNDGIVPLRTSCLLFLDWQGLGKVEKARRENGAVGGLVEWGWGQLTSGNSRSGSPRGSSTGLGSTLGNNSNTSTWFSYKRVQEQAQKGEENPTSEAPKTGEPTKWEMETSSEDAESSVQDSTTPTAFSSFMTFFRPHAAGPSTRKRAKDAPKIYRRSQTIKSELVGSSPLPSLPFGSSATAPDLTITPSLLAPPRTSILEAAGDVLNPPLPSTTFIISPSSRPRTIFHDRIYKASDIPPPPPPTTTTPSPFKVEEKIARAYHNDLSWRKVLVRLEPDAHNNMVVRRMFPNAYGWPVVQHVCETHFGASFAALVPDELESKDDRADQVAQGVDEEGGVEIDPSEQITLTSTSSSGKWTDRAFVFSDEDDDDDEEAETEEEAEEEAELPRRDFVPASLPPAPASAGHKSVCLDATVARVQAHADTVSAAPTGGIVGVGLPRSDAVAMLERQVHGGKAGDVEAGEDGEGVVERVARLGFTGG